MPSYFVISSIIIHIVLWYGMLLYAVITSIVLCYYLCIIPYAKSKTRGISFDKLLRQTHQAYSIS